MQEVIAEMQVKLQAELVEKAKMQAEYQAKVDQLEKTVANLHVGENDRNPPGTKNAETGDTLKSLTMTAHQQRRHWP